MFLCQKVRWSFTPYRKQMSSTGNFPLAFFSCDFHSLYRKKMLFWKHHIITGLCSQLGCLSVNFVSKSWNCRVVKPLAIVSSNDGYGETRCWEEIFVLLHQPSASPVASMLRTEKALADSQGEAQRSLQCVRVSWAKFYILYFISDTLLNFSSKDLFEHFLTWQPLSFGCKIFIA